MFPLKTGAVALAMMVCLLEGVQTFLTSLVHRLSRRCAGARSALPDYFKGKFPASRACHTVCYSPVYMYLLRYMYMLRCRIWPFHNLSRWNPSMALRAGCPTRFHEWQQWHSAAAVVVASQSEGPSRWKFPPPFNHLIEDLRNELRLIIVLFSCTGTYPRNAP